ncbi:MAG: VOC family protein [Rudaea sp.]
MATNRIDPQTRLGYVHLTVSDLGVALPFYTATLGFRLHRRTGDTAWLGAGGEDLLVLTENPGAKNPRHATGLYHFAILVPSRLELARSLARLAEVQAPLQGFADHLVSEAIYLADPDGNGIEIYRDRPRSEWHDERGRLLMATDPLDVRGVLAELEGHPESWKGLHPGTVLGHMHLQVSHVRPAEAFYRQVLGMDVMINMGTASFVSAGGYHHHIGMNTWQSAGAPPPPADSIGLRYFTVQLPGDESLRQLMDRVYAAGIGLEETEQGLLVRDPSHNGLVLTTARRRRDAESKAQETPERVEDAAVSVGAARQ